MLNIQSLVSEFAEKLTRVIESEIINRARASVSDALEGTVGGKRRGGERARNLSFAAALANRRKAPPQLCPVPGCKNRAAPIFGMVCADHKGLPKAKIKKYRMQRRVAKAKQLS
jgi:hypothetical protein